MINAHSKARPEISKNELLEEISTRMLPVLEELQESRGTPANILCHGNSKRYNHRVKMCACGCGESLTTMQYGQPTQFKRGHHHRRNLKPPREIELTSLYSDFLPCPENRAWVYVFWGPDREALYVGKVVRFHYMGRFDEHSHKSSWWDEVAHYSVQEVPVPDVAVAESQAIRALNPKYNQADTAKCGTLSGYKRHIAKQEAACEACREASNEHRRARNRSKGILPVPVPQCGTYGGYGAHLRRGETPCDACRAANTKYSRNRRQQARGVQQASARTP